MGIIKFLQSNPIGKKIQSGIEKVGTILSQPVASVKEFVKTGTIKKSQERFVEESVSNPVGKSIKIAAGYGTTALAVGTAGGSGVATAIVKTAITKPILTGAVLVGGGILAESKKAQELVKTTNPVEFGQDIGKAIENPSVSSIKEILTDNPLISGVVGAVAGAGLIKAGSSLYQGYKTGELTEALNNAELPTEKGSSSISSGIPVTPQTQTIKAGTTKTRRKTRRKAPTSPNINIKIDNRDNYTGGKRFK